MRKSIGSNVARSRRTLPLARSLPLVLLVAMMAVDRPWAQNGIVNENALPGNPSTEWDISGAGDLSIQGFATEISVDQGQTVTLPQGGWTGTLLLIPLAVD